MAWRLFASGKFGALLIGAGAMTLVGSHWWAYQQGKQSERDRATEAVAEYQERVIDAERRLRDAQRARQDAQREALKGIRDAEDPTGCADQRPPDSIRDRL